MPTDAQPNWYHVADEDSLASPCLLLFDERIDHNLRLMLDIAGGPQRLRPHVKTHKLGPLVQRQLQLGITKYKCSTLAEVAMVIAAGGRDVLLAMPAVAANAQRLAEVAKRHPEVIVSTLADHAETVSHLSAVATATQVTLGVYLELDCGMGRTGIVPGAAASAIVSQIQASPGLRFAGLHAYDGHIHDAELAIREQRCEEAFGPVLAFKTQLEKAGTQVPDFLAGGSPTFGIHARHPERSLSPGTTVLWDFGYGDRYADLAFLPAAVLLTRIVSKPGQNRITVDLGHKSVAPEQAQPRVRFLDLPDAEVLMQSEEHLVLAVADSNAFSIGQALHGIPRHVCPTVSMHGHAHVIRQHTVAQRWEITARNR
jgi:D-serine deaminase-like pyridoxal phosphate-dependent protein